MATEALAEERSTALLWQFSFDGVRFELNPAAFHIRGRGSRSVPVRFTRISTRPHPPASNRWAERTAVGRQPKSHTPLDKMDLLAIQAEMRQKTIDQLCREYESVLELAKFYGRQPCKQWVIQTLVQVWRELHRRTAKGR